MRKMIDFPKRLTCVSRKVINEIVKKAIDEDIGIKGDLTSFYLLGNEKRIKRAVVIAKQDGVICGVEFFVTAFKFIDEEIEVKLFKKDGDSVKEKDIIAEIKGTSYSLLAGERVALNFLGFLSGISTKVNLYAQSIRFSQTKLLDTRKTLPGLRLPEKYAVAIGGGYNHRYGLYDMILIKENHIASVGSLKEAVRRAKELNLEVPVEVEINSMAQIDEVLETDAEIVMLDNMNNENVEKAFNILKEYKYVEVSGNVDQKRLIELAEIGVDFVSMGELTHTIKPLDISMLIE
ncbi:MAG: carboxylating nicotinate-nucleotide diphosphorylase [Brevinematia bacterium]